MENAAEMAEAARRAAETGRRRGRVRGCGAGGGGWLRRSGGGGEGLWTRARLSHTRPGRSSPWQNLSAFIGASVTLLIGY